MNLDKMLRRLFWVVGIGVLGHLTYSLLTTDREQFSQLVAFSWGWFLLAMVLAVIPWFWHSIRLLIWSDFLKQKIQFTEVLQIVVATDLGSAVTPSWVGGGPVKVGLLHQKGFSLAASTMLLALASFEDILFYVLFIPISIFWTNTWDNALVVNLIALIKDNGLVLLAGSFCLWCWVKFCNTRNYFGKSPLNFYAGCLSN